MKIDGSTLAILLFFVTPGYLTYWVRNHFVPRSQSPRGTTEELAGFVVVSAFIHCLLGSVATFSLLLHGAIQKYDPTFDFPWVNSLITDAWWQQNLAAGLIGVIAYFLVSCMAGLAVGVPMALYSLSWEGSLWSSFREELDDKGAWLRRHGIRGVIAEQPAIYTALRPGLGKDGQENVVLVEAELRDGCGFYIGQVASYSISKDEDAHKLLLLRQAQYSKDRVSDYGPPGSGTVLIDLADVLVLRVTQVPGTPEVSLPNPPESGTGADPSVDNKEKD